MSKLETLKMYFRKSETLAAPTDIYAHKVTLLDGGELDLATLRGRPTLIVNTASKCGFTPQYEGLQKLYATYHERGLQMLGSPSGDFADQELDSSEAIGAFCQKHYGVQFPLTAKTSVRQHPDPLWKELGSQPNSGPPNWNFAKYLVDADGKLIRRWGTKIRPDDPELVAAIEAELAR